MTPVPIRTRNLDFGGARRGPLRFPPRSYPEKPKTDATKHATQLYAEIVAADGRVQEAVSTAREAFADLESAKAAWNAEIERGGREGRDAEKERELSEALRRCEIFADPDTLNRRGEAAWDVQDAAVTEYQRFVHAHLPEILTELEGEAEKVSEELQAALAKLAPVEQKYEAVAERVGALVRSVHAADPDWSLAPSPLPPMPDRALWDPEHVAEPDAVDAAPRRMTVDPQSGEIVEVTFDFGDPVPA